MGGKPAGSGLFNRVNMLNRENKVNEDRDRPPRKDFYPKQVAPPLYPPLTNRNNGSSK